MKQKIYNIGINLLIALFVFISVILPIFGPPIRRWIQDSNKPPEQIARETHERLMKMMITLSDTMMDMKTVIWTGSMKFFPC